MNLSKIFVALASLFVLYAVLCIIKMSINNLFCKMYTSARLFQTEIKKGRKYSAIPLYEYKVKGKRYTLKGKATSDLKKLQTGQLVFIRYSEKNPNFAFVCYGSSNPEIRNIIVAMIFAVLLIIGAVILKL